MKNSMVKLVVTPGKVKTVLLEGIKFFSVMVVVFIALALTGSLTYACKSMDPVFATELKDAQ